MKKEIRNPHHAKMKERQPSVIDKKDCEIEVPAETAEVICQKSMLGKTAEVKREAIVVAFDYYRSP